MKLSYISIPSVIIHSIPSSALLTSPKRPGLKHSHRNWKKAALPSFWLSLIAGCLFLFLAVRILMWQPPKDISSCDPLVFLRHTVEAAANVVPVHEAALEASVPSDNRRRIGTDFLLPLPPHSLQQSMSEIERQFWTQPNNQGYVPCLNFSARYKNDSRKVAIQKQKYLIVIVAGGLNQQRNQIVDAVVIARILEAALVVPILQVNPIWKDESEFSDIFDVEHFKKNLKDDVLVVSSLPSTHVMTRPVQERSTPLYASPQWFRRHYLRRFNREGVLLLRGIDERLSKDLPPDLQKLKCHVAFHALRFTAPIMEVGNQLARRMWEKGPYVALHLRLEKDVWVRTGCLPGLGRKFDEQILHERIAKPKLLTGRSNMTYTERKLAGLCPLNAAEVVRLLRGLGAPRDTRIFWAGGEPLGGELALRPLVEEFGHLYDKQSIALPGELKPFANKASVLAAVDYLICLNSDVFMPSHGGNMGRALQGHRAYAAHRKYITPNKREMLPYFLKPSLSGRADLDLIIQNLHNESLGQPNFRIDQKGRDVLAHPANDCMCNGSSAADRYRSM